MTNYIPRSDIKFNLWQGNLMKEVQPKLTDWNIPEGDFNVLKSVQDNWNISFTKSSNKNNRTSADVQAKNDARKVYEKQLRGFVAQWLTSNSKIPNGDRERMGITIKSRTRTAVPKPVTIPVGDVDFSIHMQHTLHFRDDSTPHRKAKPAGTHGCEIWMKLGGDAPRDANELSYIITATRTPFVKTFDGNDAGKRVYYQFRWVNTRGEQGPWSNVISAMVVF